MPDLFAPMVLTDLTLANRIVMAPLTRNRADAQGVPTATMATYHGQRAGAGLVVSESAPISAQAVRYSCTPGLYCAARPRGGWRS